jgi:hypothetical protein
VAGGTTATRAMPEGDDAETDRSWDDIGHREVFDGRTLSDLFVNLVPVCIIAAFVALFSALPLYGSGSEPLLAFHAAIVGGVALVSYVAARAIAGDERRLGLDGSVAARGGVDGPAGSGERDEQTDD